MRERQTDGVASNDWVASSRNGREDRFWAQVLLQVDRPRAPDPDIGAVQVEGSEGKDKGSRPPKF